MAGDRQLGLLLVAVAGLLACLTLLNAFALPRYAPAGEAVSVLPPQGLSVVNASGADIVRHDVDVPLDVTAKYYRVTVEAEGFNIEPGSRGWHRARIVMLQKIADGRIRWDLPHVIALLQDSPIRWTFEATFRTGYRVTSLVARMELLKATGHLIVHDYQVQPMKDAPGYQAASDFLFYGWLILLIAMLGWVIMRLRMGRWLTVPLAITAATALFLSLAPADVAAPAKIVAVQAVDLVASSQATAKEKTAAVADNFFSIAKSGHVLMFIAVGFMFGLSKGGSRALTIWLLAVFFSVLCEMLQLYSPNRAPSAFDLVLNTGGATIGFVLSMLALKTLSALGFRPERI